MTKQRCGSCRWWRAAEPTILGDCLYPLPESVDGDRYTMHPSEGTTCPVYAPREGGKDER